MKAAASREAGSDTWNIERFAGTHKFAIFIFLSLQSTEFSFEISASRRPSFPFHYIEQCSASRQPLQSPFNYFINNHYCPVYYSDQLFWRVKFDDHIFRIDFTNQKYVLFACHMSYLLHSKFYSVPKKRNESSLQRIEKILTEGRLDMEEKILFSFYFHGSYTLSLFINSRVKPIKLVRSLWYYLYHQYFRYFISIGRRIK